MDDVPSISEDPAAGEVEQRLRLALESGWLGTWDLDLDTDEYKDISEIWLAHFGHPDPPPRTQEEFLDRLVHPDDRERVCMAAQDALAHGHDYAAQYRCIWADGSVHAISAHGRQICDATGRARRMVGVTRDITEERERDAARERDLAEAQERADRDPLTGLLNHRAFHSRLAEEARRAERQGTTLAVAMLDLDGFKFFNDAHGHPIGDEVLRLTAKRLQEICRPYDTLARFGGDEFALILPGVDAIAGELEARLRADLAGLAFHPAGEASPVPITVSVGVSLLARDETERQEALLRADQRLRRAKAGVPTEAEADQVRLSARSEVDGFSMLDALVTAVDNKDRYTRRHSEDVLTYSVALARALGMSEAERRTVAVAALLHDVGKIGVPDAVLRKPGRLTEAETASVRLHPTMGAALVSTTPGLEDTLNAVRHHHERWDGNGYPAGLREAETPLMARLMAVADAYSAMTTDRPYRAGMKSSEALACLLEGAGAQWDPQCVEAFLQIMH